MAWVGKLFGGRAASLGYELTKGPHLLQSKEFSLDSNASFYFLFF